VRDKASGILYAMKVLKKDYIIRKNQVEHTKTERSVLGYARHPFIVGLNMAFQTADKLFFVLDYCAGGELFFHLGKVGRFPEERARYYAAQIVLALEYVHKLGVIYRDLKPENVLLDQIGNVRLTDFGLSKEGVSDHATGANSFCGTPEYIAPEVLLRQGHGRAVDWWSLGALLYEMITGLPPFYSRNRETMFEKIMKAELTFPPTVSETAKDLLSHLLVRNPQHRLGSGEADAQELKAHPFFMGLAWEDLEGGKLPPPWVPSVMGSLDTSQFDSEFTSMMPIVSPDVRDAYFGSLDRAFEGFTFVDDTAAQYMTNRGNNNAGNR
jgi:serine/threonine protein kinase